MFSFIDVNFTFLIYTYLHVIFGLPFQQFNEYRRIRTYVF